MDLVAFGILVGISGTVAMDSLNYLFSQAGIVSRIDIGMIGRMAAGWTKGRFRYRHPDEMHRVRNEVLYGYLAHYAIGVGFAVPYVVGWEALIGDPASPAWALAWGVATTVASWFFVFPSQGFGLLGWRSPAGVKAPFSSLANHLFYGAGMAVGIALA